MAPIWRVALRHAFLIIAIVTLAVYRLVESASEFWFSLLNAIIAPMWLMCTVVTMLHIALSKLFGFAAESLPAVRGAICILLGLLPYAAMDYWIAHWLLPRWRERS